MNIQESTYNAHPAGTDRKDFIRFLAKLKVNNSYCNDGTAKYNFTTDECLTLSGNDAHALYGAFTKIRTEWDLPPVEEKCTVFWSDSGINQYKTFDTLREAEAKLVELAVEKQRTFGKVKYHPFPIWFDNSVKNHNRIADFFDMFNEAPFDFIDFHSEA